MVVPVVPRMPRRAAGAIVGGPQGYGPDGVREPAAYEPDDHDELEDLDAGPAGRRSCRPVRPGRRADRHRHACTTRRGKRRSTSSCAAARSRPASRPAVRPGGDYTAYVDGKPRADGVRDFLASRGITPARGQPGRPAGRATTVNGLGNRKNGSLLERRSARTASRSTTARVRYLRGRTRRRAAPGRRLVQRQHRRRARGHRPRRAARGAGRRRDASASEGLRGKPAPGHLPRRRRAARRRRPAQAAVFEDALAGVAAGRAGGFGYVVGVDRVGQADELRDARRRRRGRTTWPSCSEERRMIDATRRHPGRAVARPGDPARPRRAGPVRVGVRAVQRAHRAARQPRRGRAARHARHLPELVLRAAAAAVRRGRLRLPRVRPDGRQRHQRQADPAAGRRRAVRRALRRAARARAGPRPARRHARPRSVRVDVAGRAAGPGAHHPAGLVHPAGGRRDRVRGRAGRRAGPA